MHQANRNNPNCFPTFTGSAFPGISGYKNVNLFHANYEELTEGFYIKTLNASNIFGYNIDQKIKEKGEDINQPNNYVINRMDERSAEISKLFYVVIWFWVSIVTWVVFRKRHYRDYFFFAANIFGAYMLFWLLGSLLFITIMKRAIPISFPMFLDLFFVFYIIVSARNAFKLSILQSIVRGSVLSLLFFIIIILYRQTIPLLSLWMINS